MIEMKVKIDGLDGFIQGLKECPQLTINELNTAVSRSIGLLQNQTIKEAPVNKQSGGGNLRQSVHSRMTSRIAGEVNVDANYGVYVHEGTNPHEIRAVNKKVLANKRTGQFFGKVVHHPGTKANPFLQRAVEVVTPRVTDLFYKALENVFAKIASMTK
jgi:HK97 gp10 family phage protein